MVQVHDHGVPFPGLGRRSVAAAVVRGRERECGRGRGRCHDNNLKKSAGLGRLGLELGRRSARLASWQLEAGPRE